MKVLQINVSINKGSTGRIAEQIGETIKKNREDSYIAFSRTGLPSKSIPIQIGTKKDVYQHVLISRLFDKHGFGSKVATKIFIEEIEIVNPDIIHLHNIHGYYLHIGILFDFLKVFNKPVVWTFHDCWPFTGHCSYFDRVDCKKWKNECYSCPLKKYYPESWFIDNSRNNFRNKKKLFIKYKNTTIVTPSSWLKDLVNQSFIKEFPTKVIHNGVDLTIFKPINSIVKKKKMILGIANIWDDRKGLNDFIKLNEILNSDYQITLLGLSNKQIDNLPKNIIGKKRTENIYDLAMLYSNADIYINPTYSDNFPTTNIEALACGTPVITYDTGGSPEAIDKNTGIIVKKGDIQGLKNAIHTITSEKEMFTVEKCRERAINKFNKDDRFMDYFNLYKDILKEFSSSTYHFEQNDNSD